MGQSISRKRPWLAALLAVLATGLGHLYLRRWRRAVGWLVLLVSVSVLFVDPAALEALANWNAVDPLAIAPLLIVGSLNVVDAYLLAHAQNAIARLTVPPDGQFTHCPHCGNELDPELKFCHWCTRELGELEAALTEKLNERDRA